jgi:hypothetical protein
MVLDNRRQDPVLPYMLNERLGFVLHKQVNRVYMGINKITQHKIYDPVSAAKRNRWL